MVGYMFQTGPATYKACATYMKFRSVTQRA